MKRAMLKIITHRKMIIGDFHVSDKKQTRLSEFMSKLVNN